MIQPYEVVKPIEDTNFGSRIALDIVFTLIYESVFSFIVLSVRTEKDAVLYSGIAVLIAGLSVMPGFGVHTTHSILDGMGKPGYGYLGGVIGSLGGDLIGLLLGSFVYYNRDDGATEGWGASVLDALMPLGIIGGFVGSIVWYEYTDTEAREAGYFSVQNVHPVIDITSERTTFGVGFQF